MQTSGCANKPSRTLTHPQSNLDRETIGVEAVGAGSVIIMDRGADRWMCVCLTLPLNFPAIYWTNRKQV